MARELKDALDNAEKHPKSESYELSEADQGCNRRRKVAHEGDADAAKKVQQVLRDCCASGYSAIRSLERATFARTIRAFDEIRPVTGRGRRAAAGSWLGAVHARRDTGAGVLRRWAPPTTRSAWRAYVGENRKRRFMLHYNFPPFSVGEVGRMGGVGRREIGHGALAWRLYRLDGPLPPSLKTRDLGFDIGFQHFCHVPLPFPFPFKEPNAFMKSAHCFPVRLHPSLPIPRVRVE